MNPRHLLLLAASMTSLSLTACNEKVEETQVPPVVIDAPVPDDLNDGPVDYPPEPNEASDDGYIKVGEVDDENPAHNPR